MDPTHEKHLDYSDYGEFTTQTYNSKKSLTHFEQMQSDAKKIIKLITDKLKLINLINQNVPYLTLPYFFKFKFIPFK